MGGIDPLVGAQMAISVLANGRRAGLGYNHSSWPVTAAWQADMDRYGCGIGVLLALLPALSQAEQMSQEDVVPISTS